MYLNNPLLYALGNIEFCIKISAYYSFEKKKKKPDKWSHLAVKIAVLEIENVSKIHPFHHAKLGKAAS